MNKGTILKILRKEISWHNLLTLLLSSCDCHKQEKIILPQVNFTPHWSLIGAFLSLTQDFAFKNKYNRLCWNIRGELHVYSDITISHDKFCLTADGCETSNTKLMTNISSKLFVSSISFLNFGVETPILTQKKCTSIRFEDSLFTNSVLWLTFSVYVCKFGIIVININGTIQENNESKNNEQTGYLNLSEIS